MGKILEIKQLSKYYNRKMALDDISLSMEEGDIMGFIGPNGAGKTTTMNILMNFIQASSGEARIFGKSVVRESHIIKKELGFMASQDFLYQQDSALKNLLYVADLKGSRSARDKIYNYADKLNLDLSQKVRKLSKGNKRKVSLIAALIGEPRMLIMDEITTGLDPVIKAHTFALLKELNQKNNCSIFFSSHILSEVEELCQQTAFIKNGSIIKLSQVRAIGNIMFNIRCENPQHFVQLQSFLVQRSDIDNLECRAPDISFQAGDTNITKDMEEARLFRLLDNLEIRRASLEQSFRADYL